MIQKALDTRYAAGNEAWDIRHWFPDLRGEHRTKPVPPKPHGFVADIDTALEQQIFYLSQSPTRNELNVFRLLPPFV